jgi:hypothetical protein
MSKAREYRQFAAECMRLAEAEPKDRDRWTRMAAQWHALAALAEKEKSSEKKESGDT